MNIRWKAASTAEHISLICIPVVIMFGESDITSNIGKERVREKFKGIKAAMIFILFFQAIPEHEARWS